MLALIFYLSLCAVSFFSSLRVAIINKSKGPISTFSGRKICFFYMSFFLSCLSMYLLLFVFCFCRLSGFSSSFSIFFDCEKIRLLVWGLKSHNPRMFDLSDTLHYFSLCFGSSNLQLWMEMTFELHNLLDRTFESFKCLFMSIGYDLMVVRYAKKK